LRKDAEHQGIESQRPANQQPDRRTHRGQIGAQIDDIRNQQKPNHENKQRPWIMASQIARNARAGHAADFRSDFLYRHHQRETEQECPAEPIAELRADLAVGTDTRGIVIRCTCNQPGAKPGEETAETAWFAHVTANRRSSAIFFCQSAGANWWTFAPSLSTATVTGKS
jgi:hypothetical protein